MKRNKYSLSNTRLLTCDMGELVPINCTEIVPGQTIQQSSSALIRMSALLAPVMHPLRARIDHYFCPNRLVWDDWPEFRTGFDKDSAASTKTFPTITFAGAINEGELADYLGVPTGVAGLVVNALPFRIYSLIKNRYYRNQQLQSALTVDTTDGADSTTNTTLQMVPWEKDYLTGAKPDDELGTDVTLPLGTSAPVDIVPYTTSTNPWIIQKAATGIVETGNTEDLQRRSSDGYLEDEGNDGIALDPNDRLIADLSSATAATVRELREALALSRYAEVRNLVGSRYSEFLRHIGVQPSDGRLDEPERLGGGFNTIQFSEVLQTGPDYDSNSGVGTLRGHGLGALRTNRYRKFFEEDGYIMSLLSVMPKTIYMQGLGKMWSKTTKEEFWNPELQHIGMQEIYNKEVYAGHSTPDGVFGYAPRYQDLREANSSVHGEFRGTNLHHWHMARKFSSDPSLNADFVKGNPTDRILASNTYDGLYVMAYNSIQTRSPVARHSLRRQF